MLTLKHKIPIVSLMRWLAVVLLIVIAFAVVIPPSFYMTTRGSFTAEIGTMDICHSATPALASDGEMPMMCGCPCTPAPPALIGDYRFVKTSFHTPVLIREDVQPPEA